MKRKFFLIVLIILFFVSITILPILINILFAKPEISLLSKHDSRYLMKEKINIELSISPLSHIIVNGEYVKSNLFDNSIEREIQLKDGLNVIEIQSVGIFSNQKSEIIKLDINNFYKEGWSVFSCGPFTSVYPSKDLQYNLDLPENASNDLVDKYNKFFRCDDVVFAAFYPLRFLYNNSIREYIYTLRDSDLKDLDYRGKFSYHGDIYFEQIGVRFTEKELDLNNFILQSDSKNTIISKSGLEGTLTIKSNFTFDEFKVQGLGFNIFFKYKDNLYSIGNTRIQISEKDFNTNLDFAKIMFDNIILNEYK